jgi:hypothetical protein
MPLFTATTPSGAETMKFSHVGMCLTEETHFCNHHAEIPAKRPNRWRERFADSCCNRQ